jgi:hypothetical protein
VSGTLTTTDHVPEQNVYIMFNDEIIGLNSTIAGVSPNLVEQNIGASVLVRTKRLTIVFILSDREPSITSIDRLLRLEVIPGSTSFLEVQVSVL